MSESAKQQLIEGMNSRRTKAIDALVGIDSFGIVHPDSGWRTKDLITHLTGWEEEGIKALTHYADGTTYEAAYKRDRIDEFNDTIYQARKDFSVEKVMSDWAAAREHLKAAVQAIPDEKFSREFYWWLDDIHITPTSFIKAMGIHERMHLNEILAVKSA